MAVNLNDLPPKAREQVAQKMLAENKGTATPPALRATSPCAGEALGAANKYKNKPGVRVLANGKEFKFDSQKEMRRFDELMILLKAGRIKDLKLQPEFTLREAYTDPEGWHIRPLKYRADFSYFEKMTPLRGGQGSDRPTDEIWRPVVEDVKSQATKTRVYEMKKQMMLEKFQIRIREI